MAEHAKPEEWKEFESEVLDRDLYEGNASVKCPGCGQAYLHLGGVRSIGGVTDRSHQTVMAERVRDGDDFPFETLVDPIVGSRGAQVELGVHCEQCHGVFVLGFQFHKGSIFLQWKSLGTCGPEENWDLWRS